MSVEAKSRMVSFRLSTDEYERFRELCFSHGLQSVSEMARKAIGLLFQEPMATPDQSLELRVAGLEGRFKLLVADMKRLEKSLRPADPHETLMGRNGRDLARREEDNADNPGNLSWQH
jgi:hypothetical protein